jgi:hypothetical protein
MRRPARLLIQVVLLSVVLNLTDWPYVDEIVEATPAGTLSELLDEKLSDAEKALGTAHSVQVGYQLLLGLQVLPSIPVLLPAPDSDKASGVERRISLYRIPPRIDRPPITPLPS